MVPNRLEIAPCGLKEAKVVRDMTELQTRIHRGRINDRTLDYVYIFEMGVSIQIY